MVPVEKTLELSRFTLAIPKMSPMSDPMVQKMIECHSTLIFMKMMQKPPLAVPEQGCQMTYFQTKNTDLGKSSRVLQWKMLVYVLYCHLVYFLDNWYI
jgi:hypothetical protein